jgi:hypothetical protein
MVEADEFMETQVKHQLGSFCSQIKCYEIPLQKLLGRSQFPSYRFMVWNAVTNELLPINEASKFAVFNGGEWRHAKDENGQIKEWRNARFLESIYSLARRGTYCADFEDRRHLTTIDWPDQLGIFPVFQYVRGRFERGLSG